MKARLAVALLAVLANALVAGPVWADTVTLKREAVVKGPKVLLGDVAEIEGDNAEALKAVELVPAALPGASRTVDLALIGSRIEKAGISVGSLEMDGSDQVKMTTLSLEITPDMLQEDLRRYVETQMPWNPGDATIDVDVPSQTIVVPDGEIEFKWRPGNQYAYIGSGAFRGEIRVDGEIKKTVLCKANVDAYGEVVVASRDIPSNKPVGPNDVTVARRLLSELPQGVALNLEEVVGAVSRATVFAGQPILARNLAQPTLIKRGDIVNVEIRSGGLTLRAQAKARGDARVGDMLMCENYDSKEQFQGVVRKDGVVVVE